MNNHITVDDLFCPFTHEDFVEQNMTGDFDKYIKHKIALQLLSGEKNNVIQAFVSKEVMGGYLDKFKEAWFRSFLALVFVFGVPIYLGCVYGLSVAFEVLVIYAGWIFGTTQ